MRLQIKIIFIARHGQPNADDEGAIAHALQQLGHEVVCVQEADGENAIREVAGDLWLWFKWQAPQLIRRIAAPKAAFYFDLVNYPDPTLAHRCWSRRRWMERTLPLADKIFATDGDFVDQDTTGKLVWLPQGADERVVGFGRRAEKEILLLFTGISKGGGDKRESFVREMEGMYGDNFRHVEHGVYGRNLADLIAQTAIVVAPDGPVSNAYFSNRAVVSLGFGAFLLHPYSARLAEMYKNGEEIVFYWDRADLHAKINYYAFRPEERQLIAAAGLTRTKSEHLYRHRLAKMLAQLGIA